MKAPYAEAGGFEPPVRLNPYVSLANWWFQPLTQTSSSVFVRLSQTRCKGSNFSINTKPCTLFFQKNIRKVLVSALFMPLSACFGWFCWACEASHACVVERIEVAYMGNVGSHPTFSIHGLRLSSTAQNAVACSSIAPAGLLPVPMPRFDVSARAKSVL